MSISIQSVISRVSTQAKARAFIGAAFSAAVLSACGGGGGGGGDLPGAASTVANLTPSANILTKLPLKPARPPAPDSVDFSKLNPVLKSVIQTVFVGEDVLQFADAHFDETVSDLGQEQVKFDVTGVVTKTPWSTAQSGSITARATTLIASERDPKRPGIRVAIDWELKTDVLGALRYAGERNLADENRPVSGTAIPSTAEAGLLSPQAPVEDKFKVRRVDLYTRLSKVSNLQELKGIVTDSLTLQQDSTRDQIASYQTQRDLVAIGKTPQSTGIFGSPACNRLAERRTTAETQAKDRADCVAYYDAVIKSYQYALNNQSKIAVKSAAGPDGAQMVRLVFENPEDFRVIEDKVPTRPQEFTVDLAASRGHAELIGFADMTQKSLDELKAGVQKDLREFYLEDGSRRKDFQQGLRRALIDYKKALKTPAQ